jgi:hypothetical protein
MVATIRAVEQEVVTVLYRNAWPATLWVLAFGPKGPFRASMLLLHVERVRKDLAALGTLQRDVERAVTAGDEFVAAANDAAILVAACRTAKHEVVVGHSGNLGHESVVGLDAEVAKPSGEVVPSARL